MKNHPQFLPKVEVVAGPFPSRAHAWTAQEKLEDAGDERYLAVWQGFDRLYYVITREHLLGGN